MANNIQGDPRREKHNYIHIVTSLSEVCVHVHICIRISVNLYKYIYKTSVFGFFFSLMYSNTKYVDAVYFKLSRAISVPP